MGDISSEITNGTPAFSKPGKRKLWTHPDPSSTQMAAFMRAVNTKYRLKLNSYEDLYNWSIKDIDAFWGEVWVFTGVVNERMYDQVCCDHVVFLPPLPFFRISQM